MQSRKEMIKSKLYLPKLTEIEIQERLISFTEGLHDMIRSYMGMILPRCLVSFLYGMVLKKKQQQKLLELLIYFTERFKVSTKCVCWYSCHSVIIWYCGMY